MAEPPGETGDLPDDSLSDDTRITTGTGAPLGWQTDQAADLPSWTATPVNPSIELDSTGSGSEQERTGRLRKTATAVLLGLALLAAAGATGWFVGRSDTSPATNGTDGQLTSATTAQTTGETTGAGVSSGSSVAEEPAAPTGGSERTTTTSVVSTTASRPFVVPSSPDNPSGATQYAVMAGGKAVMRGWYPTADQARAAVADAAEIMGGMENVVDETEIDPRAEIQPDSFAVYLQDFILFESDSAEITPEFYDFLGFPLFFMQNNPVATVTVVARTDARGTESYNLELATRRAEAVRDHWLANGGNADQIILDPRGEEEADPDPDEQQAALDRRVELQVSGFLAG